MYPQCIRDILDLIESRLTVTYETETEKYYSTYDQECSQLSGFRELIYAYASACQYCELSQESDISDCNIGAIPPECGESGEFSYSACSGAAYIQIFPDGIYIACSAAKICVYKDEYGSDCSEVQHAVTVECMYTGESGGCCDCCPECC
jgi:hypothetical protein